MERVRLHVNIDHIATLRQARGTRYPDPVWAASICELAGADGITAHLREDRRHIQDRDIHVLRKTVRSVLNLEMAATQEMVGIALQVQPDIVTLVPEKRQEQTTEGGLALGDEKVRDGLASAITKLREGGMEVSLFIDPDQDSVKFSKELGADIVELHTGDYCNVARDKRKLEIQRLAGAAVKAAGGGMKVAAGHGLDYPNTEQVAGIPVVEELNIGHAIISRAAFTGLEQAVRDMIAIIKLAAYS